MSSSSTETLVDVTMPQMGVSVAEGTVVEWKKQVGDWVEADEIIASISTDKIDTDVESPGERPRGRDHRRRRRDRRRRHRDGADRHRRQAGRGARLRERRLGTGEAAAALEAPGEAGELIGDTRDRDAQQRRRRRRRYSPVVMRIAAEHDVDLEQVEGTGRGGRVRKKDVLAFVECGRQGRAADAHREPVPARRAGRAKRSASRACSGSRRCRAAAGRGAGAASRRGQPLSRMRQAIGSRMVQSLQTAATCTTIAEADMTRIEAARKAARPQLPALPGAGRRSRRCSSSRSSTPRSRATPTPSTPTPCTSASPSRSARAA